MMLPLLIFGFIIGAATASFGLLFYDCLAVLFNFPMVSADQGQAFVCLLGITGMFIGCLITLYVIFMDHYKW